MPLRALVLLDVVHQHFQPAVYAAVIEIESEAPDLERLAAAFVLAGIDSGVELLEDLVVAGEQRALEDFALRRSIAGSTGLAVMTTLSLAQRCHGTAN